MEDFILPEETHKPLAGLRNKFQSQNAGLKAFKPMNFKLKDEEMKFSLQSINNAPQH